MRRLVRETRLGPEDFIYPLFDPTGLVTGVTADGHDFAIRILHEGRTMALKITADDI